MREATRLFQAFEQLVTVDVCSAFFIHVILLVPKNWCRFFTSQLMLQTQLGPLKYLFIGCSSSKMMGLYA